MHGLERKYRVRKDRLLNQLSTSLDEDAANTDWDDIANELHRLAGVAANFGDAELGEVSRRLENALKKARQPELCLDAVRGEWEDLQAAA